MGRNIPFPPNTAKKREALQTAPWRAFLPKYKEAIRTYEIGVMGWLQKQLKVVGYSREEIYRKIRGDLYEGGKVRPTPEYVRTCTREHGVPRFLTPFQKQVVDALSRPETQEVYGIGPNRAGKSMIGGLCVAWFCQGVWPVEGVVMPEPPVQVWCGVPDLKNHALPVTLPILRWALGKQGVEYKRKDTMFLVCSHLFSRGVPCQPRCRSPNEVYLKTYESPVSAHQGGAPAFIWDDEIPGEEVFGEHRSRIGGAHPLRILVTLTPLRQASWMNNEIREPWLADGKPPEILFTDEMDIEDNPYLSQESIDQVYRAHRHNPEELEVRTKGRWAQVSGKVYSMLKRDVHVVNDFEIPGVHRVPKEREEGWTLYRAHDPGVRNFAVVLWVAVAPDGLCYVYRELYVKDRTIKDICRTVYGMQTPLENSVRWEASKDAFLYSVIDPSAAQRDPADLTKRINKYAAPYEPKDGADWRDRNHKYGIVFHGGNNDRAAGIDAMLAAFSYTVDPGSGEMVRPPKYRFFDSCPQVWREHTRYSWLPHNPTSPRGPRDDAQKKDDHGVDALRYLEATYGGPRFRSARDRATIEIPEADPVTGY